MTEVRKTGIAYNDAGKKYGSPLWDLIGDVGQGTMTLALGEKNLRTYVAELSEEDRAEFKRNTRKQAEHLRQVAEAFSQLLTVIGAGQ